MMPHATMTQVGETDALPFYRYYYWEPSSQGYTIGGRARNAGEKCILPSSFLSSLPNWAPPNE